MNDRIKQLHGLNYTRIEALAMVNAEFGVDLRYSSFCDRERGLGLRFRGARATGEESERLNARIRQLWEQKTPGREIVEVVLREFGRDFTPGSIYSRARKMGLEVVRAQPRPSSSRELVPEAQRGACLDDPAWEARPENKIADRTACRECFRFYKGGLPAHLKAQHHMTTTQYRQLHPGARLFSFEHAARDTGRDCKELMQEFANSYATPEERARASELGRNYYSESDGFTICCVPRCGLKCTDLNHHLRNVHHMSGLEYRAKYGLHLPSTPPAILAQNKRQRKTQREKFRTADKAVRTAEERVDKLTQELKKAKADLAKAKTAKTDALPIADIVRAKLTDPHKHPWMSPNEVAAALGISPATFYRKMNARTYHRLRPNDKGHYLTSSVLEQQKDLRRKK
jgi:predicted transcriptional regulator